MAVLSLPTMGAPRRGRTRPADPIDEQIAERVRRLIAAEDLTQDGLRRKTGISSSAISRYLHPDKNGVQRGMPASAILKISQALGVTICALYGVQEVHEVNPQAGQYATDQPGRTTRVVAGNLIEGWARLPPPEQEFLREITAAASRLRERLIREEGL